MKTVILALVLLVSTMALAAPKQIIILSAVQTSGPINISYVLWVTTSSPTPKPGAVSAWPGASASENAALVAGTTIEIVGSLQVPPGTTKTQVQTQLQTIFTSAQAQQTSQPQGCFFDGSVWSC